MRNYKAFLVLMIMYRYRSQLSSICRRVQAEFFREEFESQLILFFFSFRLLLQTKKLALRDRFGKFCTFYPKVDNLEKFGLFWRIHNKKITKKIINTFLVLSCQEMYKLSNYFWTDNNYVRCVFTYSYTLMIQKHQV